MAALIYRLHDKNGTYMGSPALDTKGGNRQTILKCSAIVTGEIEQKLTSLHELAQFILEYLYDVCRKTNKKKTRKRF